MDECRLIKNYGFVEKFGEEIYVTHDTVKDFELPGARILVSKNFKDYALCFEAEQVGYKDKNIVTITLKYESGCPELKDCTASIDVDEIEFCDAIFDCVIAHTDESEVLRGYVTKCAELLFAQFVAHGYSFYSYCTWCDTVEDYEKVRADREGR